MAKREHWLRNFRFLHDPVGEGYAHRGFNQTLQWPVRADYDARERPLQDVLYEALRELRQEHPECTRLVLCGHSAGGAMAQVLAAYYLEQPADAALKLEELYTFASPRALTVPAARKVTQHFAQRGDSNCLRFVHHQDNVAQLPPKKIFLWHGEDRTYRHVGQPVVILPDLELLTPKSVTQFQKLHGVSATFARGGTPEIDSTKLSPHHLSAVREKDEAGLREFARKGSGGDVLLR
jgi:pimeloyl-ACP methyl ester carboxylesterase